MCMTSSMQYNEELMITNNQVKKNVHWSKRWCITLGRNSQDLIAISRIAIQILCLFLECCINIFRPVDQNK